MKHQTFALALLCMPAAAIAQVPVPAEVPLVNQYIADTFEQRSAVWWEALESQLMLMLDKPVEQVDENVLRNIIFFAHNHGDKLDLRKASPQLLRIYSDRHDVGFKILALAALHAIGDEDHLRQAFRIARSEHSERILKMTRAALADIHRQDR